MAGVKMVHVPYRGQGPALADLLGGQVQVLFATTPGITDYITSGRLRALGVTTASRVDVLPDVPPVGDVVAGYEASQWYGLSAPRKTPMEIVELLNREINARLADLGGEPLPGSPSAFGAFIGEETAKWAKVVSFAGIKAQ
jgi:tripartite-type tricarboxylate transporter receptor subunit TctC